MMKLDLATAPREIGSVFDWLLANLDRLAIGALIAAAIVARDAGHALDSAIASSPTNRRHGAGAASSAACSPRPASSSWSRRRSTSSPATPRSRPSWRASPTSSSSSPQRSRPRSGRARSIVGVIRSRVGEDPGASTLGNAMALIRVLVNVAVFAIALIVILDNLGVNVTALVAGLGIGGIAIGLAAQGIFSDLFAALSIVFDKPFRRGDTIRYGDDHRHGRADRPQDHPAAQPDRRAGHHGQHQAARAGSAQPRRGQGPAHRPSLQPDLPDVAGNARAAARYRRGGGQGA